MIAAAVSQGKANAAVTSIEPVPVLSRDRDVRARKCFFDTYSVSCLWRA